VKATITDLLFELPKGIRPDYLAPTPSSKHSSKKDDPLTTTDEGDTHQGRKTPYKRKASSSSSLNGKRRSQRLRSNQPDYTSAWFDDSDTSEDETSDTDATEDDEASDTEDNEDHDPSNTDGIEDDYPSDDDELYELSDGELENVNPTSERRRGSTASEKYGQRFETDEQDGRKPASMDKGGQLRKSQKSSLPKFQHVYIPHDRIFN
jgi:hypothetical protein